MQLHFKGANFTSGLPSPYPCEMSTHSITVSSDVMCENKLISKGNSGGAK